jgi:glycerate kinase
MRVVIAPGSFGPALSAVAAAQAIAAGWSRRAPGDELLLVPVSDGGEGYVDVLRESLPEASVGESGSDGGVLEVGSTAYVEAAQGLADVAHIADPERASSVGVGRLLAEALATGASRVVVGVAARGVACNDGGAGLLAGLGATADPPGALLDGSTGLAALHDVDLAPVLARIAGVRLELATDDETPLLGLLGTTNTAGRARGLSDDRVPVVDARLERLAALAGRKAALTPGAGAGGGIGYALLALGAQRMPGLASVLTEIRLADLATRADLVVTGEQAFDLSAGSGLTVTGVARVAGSVARPCIVLAERVAVGVRECRALGIESAYAVADLQSAKSGGDAGRRLATLAERAARTWSWSH